jgi:hypothetical protein
MLLLAISKGHLRKQWPFLYALFSSKFLLKMLSCWALLKNSVHESVL